ncbi:hypothetical protein C7974DRAFT_40325 [Boeremia exigua]|uniref:uncharacterized protein n=1 Tax=Boeremia exigua TaxID=749465 RepID=UPI001E8D4A70|nr:uncharacterized protein C7974DRAFT_40325 [Boeremia exigua]KAH6618999.1 hypothetical protein C7974DRAFT_40325 [Boeremia exigua]
MQLKRPETISSAACVHDAPPSILCSDAQIPPHTGSRTTPPSTQRARTVAQCSVAADLVWIARYLATARWDGGSEGRCTWVPMLYETARHGRTADARATRPRDRRCCTTTSPASRRAKPEARRAICPSPVTPSSAYTPRQPHALHTHTPTAPAQEIHPPCTIYHAPQRNYPHLLIPNAPPPRPIRLPLVSRAAPGLDCALVAGGWALGGGAGVGVWELRLGCVCVGIWAFCGG